MGHYRILLRKEKYGFTPIGFLLSNAQTINRHSKSIMGITIPGDSVNIPHIKKDLLGQIAVYDGL